MHTHSVADIQNNPDSRNLPVNRVGIKGLKHPFIFEDTITSQPVVGVFDMMVNLPKNVKGTHMSRFLELLNEQEVVLSVGTLKHWVTRMVSRLDANNGYLKAKFTIFIKKFAPISKIASLMDYEITFEGILENQSYTTLVTIVIPVTSLCPCSKEIANYGAHNQRSHVTVTVKATEKLSIIEIIQLIESKSSCELYGILKRTDEKFITEHAYDNPKFVEDMVRDIARALENLPSVKGFKISSENFESIHNHSAYAEIDKLHAITPPFKQTASNIKTVSEIT